MGSGRTKLKWRLTGWAVCASVIGAFAALEQRHSETVPIRHLVASREATAPVVKAVTVGLTARAILASSVNHTTRNTVISSSSVNHITRNTVISSSSVNHITRNTVISSSSVQHITRNTVISSSLMRVSALLFGGKAELPQPRIQTDLVLRRSI